MHDLRPDEAFWATADLAVQHGFKLVYSCRPMSKVCLDWQSKAAPLRHTERGAARGEFTAKARKREPALPAVANNLILAEIDLHVAPDAYPPLDQVKARCADLLVRLGLRFPLTLTHRSRRGVCFYLRPPAGCAPAKVQIAEQGDVSWSSDGYTMTVPARHESYPTTGVVYEFIRSDGGIVELPLAMYERLRGLAGASREEARRRYENGEPIGAGSRRDTVFSIALQRFHDGDRREHVLAELLGNAAQFPGLTRPQIVGQVDGAAKHARQHPSAAAAANAQARRVLAGQTPTPLPRKTAKTTRRLSRRALSGIAVERVELLAGLPVGVPSLVCGIGGLGKSAHELARAKQVTDQGGAVLVVSYEDSPGIIRARAEAVGCDLDLVSVLSIGDGEISFPADLPELDRHVTETKARLLIVDPVSASIDLKLDSHRDRDVRVVLGQLARLAERRRLLLSQIAHLNKAPSLDVYVRVNGSTAFYNAARFVVTVTPDPSEPEAQRILAAHKNNHGAIPPPERWRVVPQTISVDGEPYEVMTMQFVEIAHDIAREDVLAPRTAQKTDEAVVFLTNALDDRDWHDSLGLKALAGARRISDRTLKRAAAELQVEHERRGFPATTWWRLPAGPTPTTPQVGPTDKTA